MAEYTREYTEDVLAKLDKKEIWRQLPADAVLLCWERPGEFCHRRIVAEWLSKYTGEEIPELEESNAQIPGEIRGNVQDVLHC